MMIEERNQNIQIDDQYKLDLTISLDKLKLRLHSQKVGDKLQKIYEVETDSMNTFGFLQKYCQNFDDFVDLLKNIKAQQNIQMKVVEGTLNIFQRHPIKKKKILDEIIIQFKQVNMKQKQACELALERIYEKCDCKEALNSQQTKQMLYLIATALEQLIKGKRMLESELLNQKEDKQRIKFEFQGRIDEIKNEMIEKQKLQRQQLQSREQQHKKQMEQFKLSLLKMEQKIKQMEVVKQQQKQKIVSAEKWIQPQFYFKKHLQISQNRIKTLTSQWTCFIFGNTKISEKSSYTVTFKRFVSVSLGIIDLQYKNLKGFGFDSENRIEYFNTGNFSIGGKNINKNNGFKIGQKITVIVNIKQSIIQWKVGTQLRHESKVSLLGNNKIIWVPYIKLCNQNDQVIINQ